MSDASAAGTLIVAVMETAGYITQERILDSFGGFFNSAGAFLYTIGCIGGLISVALFGSFRAARYLLIGPTLYWFVIGPRADIPGAMWKLGDGQPRNHQGVVTEEEAVLTSRRASAEPKDENEYIRVSYFFYLYSHVINGVVHDFVSAILEHEDDEDLLFVARTQAIENLYRTEVGEGQLWQMLRDNYYGSCEKMLSAEYGKSSPELSDAHLQDMTLRRSSVPANSEEWNLYNHQVEQITARRAFYADLSAKAALIEVKPNQATLRYIQENMLAAQRPGINYLFRGGRDPELDPQEFQNEKFGYNITCGELWQIIADAARDEARSLWEKEYQKSGLTGQYSEQQFCSEIAKKMERSASPCDLTSTISMWLLRSAILKLNDQGDVQGFVNNMQFRKRIRRETFQIIDKDGQSNVSFDEANPVLRMNSSGDLEMQVYQLNDAGELDRDKLGNITSEKKWMPYFVVKQTAENEFGAAFTEHQRYQTHGIRQSIFTWATNLPYWQGTILYLLGMSYPILALVIVVPGRAITFLNLPLAWLWVKSWDIGFALVIILEKVLWNMFPVVSSEDNLNTTALNPELGTAFKEAFKVDPTYNAHAYYYTLSIAMMAIPPITAYATIKAKKSVLSSFTDAPQKAADDAAGLASGGYGMQQMNNFNQAMQASMGQGMAAAVGGNNLFASNRMIKAFAWGAGVGASSALAATTGDAGSNPDYRNNFDKKQYGSYKDALADAQKRESEGRMRPQDRNLLRSARNQRGKNIRGGIDKFARDTLNTAFSILSADAKLDAVNGYLHDKRFGRWSGSITSNYEATAAALDGSGGFELMMERDAGIGELVDNFMAQVRAGKKILDNLGQAGGNLLANLLEERDARRGQKKKEEQEQEEQEQAADRQAEARKGKGGPRGVPKGDEAEANARGYAGRKRREGGTAEEVISDAVDEVIEEGGSKIIELFKKGLASTAAGADRYGAYAPGLVNFIMAVTADGEDPNDRFGKKDDAFYGYFGHSRAAKSWSWENTE